MAEKIRVFVGCAPDGLDAESMAVLEWSIIKHASRPVEITWMNQGGLTGWETSAWATPFSGFRWAVPELAGFTGKAIYMDSDMIVLSDLAGLFDQDTAGHVVLAKGCGQWRLCVSLWDCEKAQQFIPPIAEMKKSSNSHRAMTEKSFSKGFIGAFSGNWNCLDREYGPNSDAKIIHYTDMSAQPQLRHALPRLAIEGRQHWMTRRADPNKYPEINRIFDELLIEATENGYPASKYL